MSIPPNRACAQAALLVLALVVAGTPDLLAQGRGGARGGGPPAPPSAPTPRWPDGKPILGSVAGQPVGGWGAGVTTLPRGGKLDEIPFQPWARAVYDIRQIDQFEPHTRCKASGVSRQFSTPYGTEFVEVPDLKRMYIMDNGGPNSYRIVYLDGRSHTDPDIIVRTFNGESIGRWEGDTLVVDTLGFRGDHHWMDQGGASIPAGEQLHIVERIRLINDRKQLEIEYTMTDPEYWEGEWKSTKRFNRVNDEDIQEVSCLPDLNEHLQSTSSKTQVR